MGLRGVKIFCCSRILNVIFLLDYSKLGMHVVTTEIIVKVYIQQVKKGPID